MINFIETENFKKLGNFKAEFTEGTNLILGDNGMGKTTFFNAVRFALYGTAAIASNAENIPTWGYKDCKVKLGYSGEFLVVRSLRDCKIYRAGDDGSLTEDPLLKVAEGNSPCTKWVREHLGLDHKMFSIFNMSMQGETGALITLGATELNRIVEEFSGVGVLDTVIKSVSKESSQLEGALGTVEHVDLADATKTVVEWKEKLSLATSAADSEKSILAELEVEAKVCLTEYQAAVKHNTEVATQTEKRATALGKVDTLTPQIETLKTKVSKTAEVLAQYDIPMLEHDLKAANDKLDEYKKISVMHSNYGSQLEKLIIDKKTYSENSVKELKVAAEKIELDAKLESQQATVTKLVEVLITKREAYKTAANALSSGTCSECKRVLENFDPAVALKAKNYAEVHGKKAKADHELACEKLREIKALIAALPNHGVGNAEKAAKCEREIKEISGKIESLEKEWGEYDDDEAKITCDSLAEKLQCGRILRSQQISDEATLKSANESLSLAKIIVDDIVVEEAQPTAEIERKIAEYETHIEDQKADLDTCTNLATQYSADLTIVTNDLVRLTKNNETFAKYSEGIDKAKRLMKFLRTSRTDYMEGVWALILGTASQWVNNTTKGWITEVGRNSKGDFTFTENGINAPVYSEASGAQKEFIGVSLRIGLGLSVKGDSAMLMLDEPTAGMRESRADQLATGLLGVGGQKIIITHRQSERLTAANVINL